MFCFKYQDAREIQVEGASMRAYCGSIFLALLSLAVFFRGAARAEEQVPTITVGYIPLLSQLPLVVSYDNDRLNYSNVLVKIVKYRSFNSLEAALRVGAVDVADLPLPVTLNIANDGLAIKILGQCHSGGSVLEGIGTADMSDLRGKIIGVPGLRSIENLVLIQALSAEKLRYGLDYKTIKVPFSTVIRYFRQGKINAIYFPEPYGTMAENDHSALQVDPRQKLLSGELTTVLTVRSDIFQEKRRKALEEWIRSVARACTFIENDITTLSGRQTAIIQEQYFRFPQALVSASLRNRRGGLNFSFILPDKKSIKGYQDQALKAAILDKQVDIDSLVSVDTFNGIIGGASNQ